jgi:hypothetical protein
MSTDGAHRADGGLPAPERDTGGVAAQLEGGAGVAASADADERSPFLGARDSAGGGALTFGASLPPDGGAYVGDATPPLLASWPADAAPDAQAATVAFLDTAAAEAGAQPAAALSKPAAGLPEAFIGRHVRRRIVSKRRGACWFRGEVLSTRFSRTDGRLWLVRYDDGTEEELNAEELRACLLPEGTQRAAAPPAAAADATWLQYKGVHFNSVASDGSSRYDMELNYLGKRVTAYGLATAEAAAHAYDAAARKRGIKVLNFPNADAGEVQAVRGESNAVTLKKSPGLGGGASAAASPRRPAPQQPMPRGAAAPAAAHGGALSMYDRLKLPRSAQRGDAPDDADEESEDDERDAEAEDDGVSKEDGVDDASEQKEHAAAPRKYKGVFRSKGRTFFEMHVKLGGNNVHRGGFANAKAAARAYDDAVRKHGVKVVNFPDAAQGEVLAVANESNEKTLRRFSSGGGAPAAAQRTVRTMPARAAAAPLRKRSRSRSPAGAQRNASARKHARGGGRDAGRERAARSGGAQQHASLEAFLRSIVPPLSQARSSRPRVRADCAAAR